MIKGNSLMKVCGIIIVLSLFVPYGMMIALLGSNVRFGSLYSLIILAGGFVRLMLYTFIPKVRKQRLLILFNLFSLEVFAIPALALVYLLSNSIQFLLASVQIFLTWPVSLSLFFIPIVILRIGSSFSRGSDYLLLYPLTLAVLSYSGLLLVSAKLTTAGQSLSALTLNMLTILFSYSSFPVLPGLVYIFTASLSATFFTMLVYPAARASRSGEVGWNRLLPLLLGASTTASVGLYGMVNSGNLVAASSFLLLLTLWIVTRK